MSTSSPPLVVQLASDWESKCGLKSAKCSGIVGDRAHEERGGYHIGRRFQSSTNYSVVRPDDKAGPDDVAAAIDMTMNASDMRLCTTRLVAAFSNPNDPRRKYINAFNGTTDSVTARRWDVYARKVKAATSDHLWHVHLEIRRKYVGSATAMKAILSVLRGESPNDFLKAAGVSAPGSLKPSTSTTAPAFPGTLRRNDSQTKPDPNVRLFQEQLRKRGWIAGGLADGYFGPKLESGVKWWQRRLGLKPDGVIGPKTWPTPWTAK